MKMLCHLTTLQPLWQTCFGLLWCQHLPVIEPCGYTLIFLHTHNISRNPCFLFCKDPPPLPWRLNCNGRFGNQWGRAPKERWHKDLRTNGVRRHWTYYKGTFMDHSHCLSWFKPIPPASLCTSYIFELQVCHFSGKLRLQFTVNYILLPSLGECLRDRLNNLRRRLLMSSFPYSGGQEFLPNRMHLFGRLGTWTYSYISLLQ